MSKRDAPRLRVRCTTSVFSNMFASGRKATGEALRARGGGVEQTGDVFALNGFVPGSRNDSNNYGYIARTVFEGTQEQLLPKGARTWLETQKTGGLMNSQTHVPRSIGRRPDDCRYLFHQQKQQQQYLLLR